MIVGEIRRHLRDSGSIKVSRCLKDFAYKSLSAKEIDTSPKDVMTAMEAICDPISLYDPIYNDGGDVIMVMDQISDKEDKEEKWTSELAINEAIDKLGDKERKILSMRFFQDKTQMEIASEIGISQAQDSRLEKNALSAMKKYIMY